MTKPNRYRHDSTRRDFLTTFAGIATAPLLGTLAARGESRRLDLAPGQAPARVAVAQSRMAVDGEKVHLPHTRELLEASLMRLTQTTTPGDAWHAIIKPTDLVGLKFNGSGQPLIGTTDAMGEVIVGSLVDAGWEASRIVCIEAPAPTVKRLGTLPAESGYDRTPTKFSSGEDEFASWVHQVSAIISVPFLKTHNICKLTCSLKNLSHAAVKHPARFHDHGCSPYIPDIVQTPILRSKLRLAIVDALRVVYYGGPVATSLNVGDVGGMIVADDLVAADAVGLALLNDVRQKHDLPPIAGSPEEIPYLVAAHNSGLGIAAPHGIDLLRIRP